MFFATDLAATPNSMQAIWETITAAAAGNGLQDMRMCGVSDGVVVHWNEDGSGTRPGPEVDHYEAAIKECSLAFQCFLVDFKLLCASDASAHVRFHASNRP